MQANDYLHAMNTAALSIDTAVLAAANADSNIALMDSLKRTNATWLDATVHRLEQHITPQVNCTDCGNCCNTLMINVEAQEADTLAQHLAISRQQFDDTYIEKGSYGMMLMNAIPCSFLSANKCTVYEYRFGGCREFPGLHLPQVQQRLFTIFMHYERCPIIYHVVEALRQMDLPQGEA